MSWKQKPDSPAKLSPQELWNEIALTRRGIDDLLKQAADTRELKPVEVALEELQVKTVNYKHLVEEMQAPMRAVLGTNFLGVEEWRRGFGVRVGLPPPMPEYITADLLCSDCPLHPGQKIKETHILILMPRAVDGKPYNALKLEELCVNRIGSGQKLLYPARDPTNRWQSGAWVHESPAESEWVLIPKSDPDVNDVLSDRHFRFKTMAEQAAVYNYYAQDYRGAKALEVMTVALLTYLVNGESQEQKMLANFVRLRCIQPNAAGGSVVVGPFFPEGLLVKEIEDSDCGSAFIGFAVARKPRS
jgi:hypothetical protein